MNNFSAQKTGRYQLQVTQPDTLLSYLSRLTQNRLSQQTLKQLLKNGSVWLQTPNRKPERVRRAKKMLFSGQKLFLYYRPELLQQTPPTPTCLADYGDYSVWHKPKGMASQGSKWGDAHALYRWVETHDTSQRPALIVHRLDKHTDGIVLLAHGKKVAAQLSQLFESRQIEKRYLAWVEGSFLPQRQLCEEPIEGKTARSWLQRLMQEIEAQGERTLLEIQIETGRKHQIRRHCTALGHPIIGDRLYGQSEKWQGIDMQLSNYFLSFPCPLSQQIRIFNLTTQPQWLELMELAWGKKLGQLIP